MEIHRAVLEKRIERAPSVESLRFRTEAPLSFLPGQFVQVIFDGEHPGNREVNKPLSLSASPLRPYVEVTKKMSDSLFSRRLGGLSPGDEILLGGPLGSCTFEDGLTPVVFLVGGIGITPVASIIEYVADKRLPTDAVLYYASKKEDGIAFKDELLRWEREAPSLRVNFFVTREKPADPRCRAGRPSAAIIAGELPDARQRTFFIYGPPRMVEAMVGVSAELGAPPQRIRTESFAGY